MHIDNLEGYAFIKPKVSICHSSMRASRILFKIPDPTRQVLRI